MIRLSQNEKERHWLFFRFHYVEASSAPPARRAEMIMSVPGWWSRYDLTQLLYVPISPVFSICTGMYMNSQDNKKCVEMTAWSENALLIMCFVYAACRSGSSSHSFRYLQLDEHRGVILVPLSTGVSKYEKVVGLYNVIQLVGYDSVLCFRGVHKQLTCCVMEVSIPSFSFTILRLYKYLIFRRCAPTRAPRLVPPLLSMFLSVGFVAL